MKKKWALPLALMVALTTTTVGCSSNDTSSDADGADKDTKAKQEINIAFRSEPEVLDMSKATAEESFTMINAFGEGLYRLDADGNPQPAMAAAMPEISEDGKTYTIKIRDNAVWADGSPVTANDFVFSWKRTLDPKTGAQYAFMMDMWIKGAEDYNTGKVKTADNVGVTAVDDKTLKVELTTPVPFFTGQLAFPIFFPEKQEFVEKAGEKFGADADTVLSNGPFILDKWDHEAQLVFKKNDKYWDADNVSLEQVTFQIIPDQNSALNMYDTGDVDITEINREQVLTWKDKPDYKAVPTLFDYSLRFNQEKVPAFANKNIRKAITMAIDRQGMVDTVLGNGSKPATGDVPYGTLDGSNHEFRQTAGDTEPAYDPDKAQELLKKGLEELGLKKMPTFTMIGDDDEVAKKSMEFIQAQLKQNLGLEPNVQNIPKKLRLDKQSSMEYDMIAPSRWGADYNDPMTFLDLWITNSPFNTVGWSNKEYDDLIAAAKVETDAKKRTQMMVDAEKILMDEMPIGPLFFLGRSYLERPSIEGLFFPATGTQYEFRWASVK
ncbi:MAG TPA: peptide ABC transporter substrate-binding protein [Bacilli bacterium]|nr:peptide ABC transporter substrate-binding protein [Bacilli bacterium]